MPLSYASIIGPKRRRSVRVIMSGDRTYDVVCGGNALGGATPAGGLVCSSVILSMLYVETSRGPYDLAYEFADLHEIACFQMELTSFIPAYVKGSVRHAPGHHSDLYPFDFAMKGQTAPLEAVRQTHAAPFDFAVRRLKRFRNVSVHRGSSSDRLRAQLPSVSRTTATVIYPDAHWERHLPRFHRRRTPVSADGSSPRGTLALLTHSLR
jgi:hypothetical protein